MNHALFQFIAEYREPATTALLWAEINSIRLYAHNPVPELPQSMEQLDAELKRLESQGRVVCSGTGHWMVVAVRKPQMELFNARS